ncbi:MAG: transcription elongation factor GreA [Candidatus Paceibacterota bacterium]
MGGTEYLTKEKFEELTNELENLKHTRRKEVAEHLEYAKSLGDLSENAEYHEAREEQATVEERIAKLENMLKNVEIVKPHHSDVVEAGATVVVRKGKSKTEVTYQIVSPEEADIGQGKISYRSPLGEKMLGHKKGDSFSFSTPNGEMEYTIVDIK